MFPVRMIVADPAADHAAPVAALGDVAVIAQHPAHQGRDVHGHAPRADGPARFFRKGVARQRRRHDMKGRGVRRAVAGRVGQRPDHLLEFDEGAGPAVDQQQGPGIRPRRAAMDIVQLQPIGLGPEMRQRVQPGLDGAPVIVLDPIPAEVAQPVRVRAERPAAVDLFFRPREFANPAQDAVEPLLRHMNGKRRRAHGQGSLSRNAPHGFAQRAEPIASRRGRRRCSPAGRPAGRASSSCATPNGANGVAGCSPILSWTAGRSRRH